MDSLQANYRDEESEEEPASRNRTTTDTTSSVAPANELQPPATTKMHMQGLETPQNGVAECDQEQENRHEHEPASDSVSEDDPAAKISSQNEEDEDDDEDEEEEEEEEDRPPKKQKQLSSLNEPQHQDQKPTLLNNFGQAQTTAPPTTTTPTTTTKKKILNPETATTAAVAAAKAATTATTKKSSKKKNNNVWVTKTSRKGKKKTKANAQNTPSNEDKVPITPVPRFPDKSDDSPDMKICLSKVYKAEKVELSEDRLGAGSAKGYRMVRATRGVAEGAWYYEIKMESLGETGHTRIGWSTEKGDLQAPVGYDGNSYGYRDVDGSKIHKALREKYGEEGYKEGDVIGFYINLPEGSKYAPKPPHLVWYKGQRCACIPDSKEDPPAVVPGE